VRQLGHLRNLIAERWSDLAEAFGTRPGRTSADTIAAEILPLADACRFLEREAEALLRPQRMSLRGRPAWLVGCTAEIRREPLGVVLVIGPANYPLFIPGVQLVQGLVAGNAVMLKPGVAGRAPLAALLRLAAASGIDPALTPLLDEDPGSACAAITAGVDKVFLTGSSATGADVLSQLAPRLTPAVMELSGNDPVFVLDGADLDMAAAAIAFGMRLNGSATCIAPRRVYAGPSVLAALCERLTMRLAEMPHVVLTAAAAQQLSELLAEAVAAGAQLSGGTLPIPTSCPPLILTEVAADARILRTALFAPVVSIVAAGSPAHAVRLAAVSPYALGASMFGPPAAAWALADSINAGCVTINDLIVPTADPRLPFGGRGSSGFGTTRGREGLLEMTAIKMVAQRRGRLRPHYRPLTAADSDLFGNMLVSTHGSRAMARAAAAARLLLHLCGRNRPPLPGVATPA
jgi:acyl-CoA reductase-like NAD-dependent aldehyde dehydrogenase